MLNYGNATLQTPGCELLERRDFHCQQGTSNKVYIVTIQYHKAAKMFQVQGHYAAFGGMLNKTAVGAYPSMASAVVSANKIENEKLRHDYDYVGRWTKEVSTIDLIHMVEFITPSNARPKMTVAKDFILETLPINSTPVKISIVTDGAFEILPGDNWTSEINWGKVENLAVSELGLSFSGSTKSILFGAQEPNGSLTVFDIGYYIGIDMTKLPWKERRTILGGILVKAGIPKDELYTHPTIRLAPYFTDKQEKLKQKENPDRYHLIRKISSTLENNAVYFNKGGE